MVLPLRLPAFFQIDHLVIIFVFIFPEDKSLTHVCDVCVDVVGCPSLGLGRRTLWLTIGASLVVICYYFVFGTCALDWFVTSPSENTIVIYYRYDARGA